MREERWVQAADGSSPLAPFLAGPGFVLLDGGLATELERRGHDLDHPLWSARLLAEDPEAIRAVHVAYLEAGADCILSASYQGTVEGFVAEGMGRDEAAALLSSAVTLACQARERYLEGVRGARRRPGPLVAASVGPYGAALCDGAEYRGDYGVPKERLRAFHEERWRLLAESEADLLGCETLPSLEEAEVLLELLRQTPGRSAWFSFSCRDEGSISDGTPIRECAALLAHSPQVAAIGINCTPPRFIAPLIDEVRRGAPGKPVVVYPNSGEVYDAARRRWTGSVTALDLAQAALEWHRQGATLIGGCCRTEPDHIRAMRKALGPAPPTPTSPPPSSKI